MRNRASATERKSGRRGGRETGAPGGSRPRFSRAQLLALVVGALQVVSASFPFLPMGEGANHTLYLCTGLAGLLLAWDHRHARLYGVVLLLLYGQLFITCAEDAGTLGLPTWETLTYGRAALAGVVIALVPAFRRR